MGDYNSPPLFEAAKTIKQNGFRDCRGRNTFPALGWPCCFWMTCCPPIFKLDYCVYRSEEYYCNEDGADVLADKSLLVASDHRPLKEEELRARLMAAGDKLIYKLDSSSPATDLTETIFC